MSMNTLSKMKGRFAAALAAGLAFVAFSGTAEAQEVELTGPLAGAPAVRELRLYRKGRVEVAPQVSFTLLDQYQRRMFSGLRLNYHFADWIGLGVWGAYGALKLPTSLSKDIESTTNARG